VIMRRESCLMCREWTVARKAIMVSGGAHEHTDSGGSGGAAGVKLVW
jgi:hypothetical protein